MVFRNDGDYLMLDEDPVKFFKNEAEYEYYENALCFAPATNITIETKITIEDSYLLLYDESGCVEIDAQFISGHEIHSVLYVIAFYNVDSDENSETLHRAPDSRRLKNSKSYSFNKGTVLDRGVMLKSVGITTLKLMSKTSHYLIIIYLR